MSVDIIEELFQTIGEMFLNAAVKEFNEDKNFSQKIFVVAVSCKSILRTFEVNPVSPQLTNNLFNNSPREAFMYFVKRILSERRKQLPDKEHFVVCGSEAWQANEEEMFPDGVKFDVDGNIDRQGAKLPIECAGRKEVIILNVYHQERQKTFCAEILDKPERHAIVSDKQGLGVITGNMVINADIHPNIERIIKNVAKR